MFFRVSWGLDVWIRGLALRVMRSGKTTKLSLEELQEKQQVQAKSEASGSIGYTEVFTVQGWVEGGLGCCSHDWWVAF